MFLPFFQFHTYLFQHNIIQLANQSSRFKQRNEDSRTKHVFALIFPSDQCFCTFYFFSLYIILWLKIYHELITLNGCIEICSQANCSILFFAHLVREENDFCLKWLFSKPLRLFCCICHTISHFNCGSQRNHTTSIINSIIAILFEAGNIFKKFFQFFSGFLFRHIFDHHDKIIIVTSCTTIYPVHFLHLFGDIYQ